MYTETHTHTHNIYLFLDCIKEGDIANLNVTHEFVNYCFEASTLAFLPLPGFFEPDVTIFEGERSQQRLVNHKIATP